jgi:uncharacterized protein
MSSTSLTDSPTVLAPVAGSERIQALDVVRGFALIGIFLMNIEFFNRPTAEIGTGLPATLQGIDWWAGYLVYVLVQGKFWTMFSLLFGMGFAVMLTRAERAGRGFLVPYLRRIGALAAFGALHHIFLWSGDILFSYAVGALCLLLLLWSPWIPLVLGMLALLGLGLGLQVDWPFEVLFGLVFVLLGAIYLRTEGALRIGGRRLPWLSLVFLLLGLGAAAVGAIAGNGPVPVDARWPLLIVGSVLSLLAYLSARYKDPAEARPRRLGPTLYLVPMTMMLLFGLMQVFGPDRPVASEALVAAATAEIRAREAAEDAAEAAGRKPSRAETKAKAEKTAKKSDAEKAAMGEAQRRINRAEREAEVAAERRMQSSGSYGELVRYRAKEMLEKIPGEFGFATLIIGMFLLGYWFVRSGIMERPAEHLPLFRKMATIGIPVGVGLGIAASFIATHRTPGMEHDPYQVAQAMMMIGNLPACLGYVGLVVVMLYSNSAFSRIGVLAPLGRMALTNYLTHSLVSSLLFYGYGAGWYGTHRATQVLFVFTVIALQVVFCTWWLSRYRYGPMEWLWRAITYWQLPAMRREPVGALGAPA